MTTWVDRLYARAYIYWANKSYSFHETMLFTVLFHWFMWYSLTVYNFGVSHPYTLFNYCCLPLVYKQVHGQYILYKRAKTRYIDRGV